MFKKRFQYSGESFIKPDKTNDLMHLKKIVDFGDIFDLQDSNAIVNAIAMQTGTNLDGRNEISVKCC